jgi:hypothetical protein
MQGDGCYTAYVIVKSAFALTSQNHLLLKLLEDTIEIWNAIQGSLNNG